MNQSNTLPTFLADENRWSAQVAGRLRLIQATCADDTRENRQGYLEEEIRHLLEEVPPGKRQAYLDALVERFPTWHRVVTAAPFAAPAPRAPDTAEDLDQAVTRVVPKLTPEERQKLREKLTELGVIEPVTHGSAEGFTALRKQVMLAPSEGLVPARLEKLAIQQVEFLVKLDQLVWTTWKALAPKSPLKRDTALGDLRSLLRRYLKGDSDVSDLQVAQQIERTRQLIAILLGSISQVSRGYTKRYQNRYSPEAVRDLVKMEGGSMLVGNDTKCWRKYSDLAAEITESSIQGEMQEIIVKYVEDLMRGSPKNSA